MEAVAFFFDGYNPPIHSVRSPAGLGRLGLRRGAMRVLYFGDGATCCVADESSPGRAAIRLRAGLGAVAHLAHAPNCSCIF